MKYSQFNSLVSLSKNVDVLYNSLTDRYLFVKKGSVDLNNISQLANGLYKQLCVGEFIVSDSKDELKEYIDFAKKIENDQSYLRLTINPTVNCNFRCWYCYEKHTTSQMSQEVIDRINNYIKKSTKKYKRIVLDFFGGEPMLYFRHVIMPILQNVQNEIAGKGIELSTNMTSNGFLFDSFKIKELKKYNFNSIQITLDGGRVCHNQTRYSVNGGSYDKIIQNVKLFVKENIYVLLRINYTNDNIGSVHTIPCDFRDLTESEKKYIFVEFHKVWQEKDVPVVDVDNAISVFEANGFKVSKQLLGGYCYADKRNGCVINYNGDVYKCTSVDFENTSRDGFLNEFG